jgi:F-type H+-transporting ATPase subunit gamma
VILAKDAKNKIRTVRSIEQICRAMKTVASIRLRRAEQRLATARLYQRGIAGVVEGLTRMRPWPLAGQAGSQEHPFLQARSVRRIGVVLVTSDRGLCGGYNTNAVRQALQVGGPEQAAVIAVGRRGQLQMARRGYQIVDRLAPLGGEPDRSAVARLADRIGELYVREQVDEVVAVYARFLGGTRTEMRADRLLPIAREEGVAPDIICEPALPELLKGVMARYLRSQLVVMVEEASASEHAARVAAMTAATDNAEEMIHTLTLEYNKARQAGITKELTEIVGTSEASA